MRHVLFQNMYTYDSILQNSISGEPGCCHLSVNLGPVVVVFFFGHIRVSVMENLHLDDFLCRLTGLMRLRGHDSREIEEQALERC